MTDDFSLPIGIFDSGVGGLTVMKELAALLPNEQLLYFGDTARVPYGTKSRQTILRYCIENAIFLFQKKIKCLVIACNTATAFALSPLQELFKHPIIGVIEAGAEAAVQASQNKRIAILGTKGTIQSGAYQSAIRNKMEEAFILPVACPLFVPLVEEGWLNHPATELVIHEYLEKIQEEEIDTVLLGCTHYPLLLPQLQKALGQHIAIVDSASTCAKKTALLLKEQNLLATKRRGENVFFVSDDPEKFALLAGRLFDISSLQVEQAGDPPHSHH